MSIDSEPKSRSIRDELEQIPGLGEVASSTKHELSRWIAANGPYDSVADLQAKLAKVRIKGLTRRHEAAIADHFCTDLGRRRFLAATAVGAASAASLGAGVWPFLKPTERPNTAPRPAPDQSVAESLAAEQQMVGQAVRSIVARQGVRVSPRDRRNPNWAGFIHALDMSNWIEAANFLYGSSLWKELSASGTNDSLSALAANLHTLYQAWRFLLEDAAHWKDEFFVGYAFGKMPALAAPAKAEHRYPGTDSLAREFMADINRLAFTFRLLEIQNQRFQQPAKTTAGAPIWFSQGHNFTYAHAGSAFAETSLFDPDRPPILVNWDAHADLGGPFNNPRIDLDAPFDRLQSAATIVERVETASVMSIAGWILALLYEGFFSRRNASAELVWIVPKEALNTSTCMETFGRYLITIGDWTLPGIDDIRRISATPVGDWNIPGQKEVRSYSEYRTMRSVLTPRVLQNQRTCVVHIMDSDNLAAIEKVLGDRQIFLSADVDYSGTQEPGLRPRLGYLPHYPLNNTPAEQARHRQLIKRFDEFYDRFQHQIRAVSIANSPDFTVDEETRKPAAQLLNIMTVGDVDEQPPWVLAEWKRVATPFADRTPDILRTVLLAGGAAGLAAILGGLEAHRRRGKRVRSVLPFKNR